MKLWPVIFLVCSSAFGQTMWGLSKGWFESGGSSSEARLHFTAQPRNVEVFSTYGAFYPNNATMTVNGDLDYWTADKLWDIISYTATNLVTCHRIADGYTHRSVCDDFTSAGVAEAYLGNTGAKWTAYTHYDEQFYLISLMYLHYLKSGSTLTWTVYGVQSNLVSELLAWPALSNSLVYVTDGVNGPQDWSWSEGIESRGYGLMGSVYRYVAMRQLAVLSGDNSYNVEAGAIKASLRTNLWDYSFSMFRWYSGSNTQHSIYGTAYAVTVGACDYDIARAASARLRSMLPGGTNYTDNAIDNLDGAICKLPKSERWDYASGHTNQAPVDYWFYPVGWVAQAVSLTDQAAADALMDKCHAAISRQGGNALFEYEDVNGNLTGQEGNYPASNNAAQYERRSDGWFYDAYNWPMLGITKVRTQ